MLVKGMPNNIFSHGNFPCQYNDDDFGVIEEFDDQSFDVDSSRSEEGVFPLQ